MNHNQVFRNVNQALPELAALLLDEGDEFGSRAGRTLELMHVGITLTQPWQREIEAPIRKANLAAQIVETAWVLAGRNDVELLSHYLPRAVDFSDDGLAWRAGYGPRLRDYHDVDQLKYVVETLKASPGSRQAVATIWDPTVDTTPGKDIACNNWLSFSSRFGKLDLHVGIRSNDFIWGWSGINAFEWSVVQEIVAGMCGLTVGSLHFSTTSFHLYDRHWEKARRIAQLPCTVYLHDDSPRFETTSSVESLDVLLSEWFTWERAIREGQTLDVEKFPEPMFRSWLQVLQWYWSGDVAFLEPVKHTRLAHAALVGVAPAGKPQRMPAHHTYWQGEVVADDNGRFVRENQQPKPTFPEPLLTEKQRAAFQQTKPTFIEYVNNLHA